MRSIEIKSEDERQVVSARLAGARAMSGDPQLALPGLISDATAEWEWCEESDDVTDEAGFDHQAVMKGEIVAALAPHAGGLYLDATLGRGGHSLGLLEAGAGRLVGLDRDEAALRVTQRRLAVFGDRVTLVHESFANVRDALATPRRRACRRGMRRPRRQLARSSTMPPAE